MHTLGTRLCTGEVKNPCSESSKPGSSPGSIISSYHPGQASSALWVYFFTCKMGHRAAASQGGVTISLNTICKVCNPVPDPQALLSQDLLSLTSSPVPLLSPRPRVDVWGPRTHQMHAINVS